IYYILSLHDALPIYYDFSGEDYDGLFISNGPGDPAMCDATVKNIKMVIDAEKPIMGICLGNQLLARAAGADTYKLKYGHSSHNRSEEHMSELQSREK